MDGYILGFMAISGISILTGIMAIIFLSFDGDQNEHDRRIRYRQIRHLTTNTIETVNLAGETEIWQRGS